MTARQRPLQRLIPIAGMTLALSAAGAAFAIGGDAGEGDGEAGAITAKLTYKALKNWDIVVPNEVWTSIGDIIPIPHSDGDGFKADKVGVMKLSVDTNADGRFDADVKGTGGYLKLRAENEDGSTFNYAIRLVRGRNKYEFAPSHVMAGKVNGTRIKVIDRNCNGRYDDYGEDAIVVGGGYGASLLSRMINAGDELFHFEISADGQHIEYSPYTGPTARVDVISKHDAKAKLVSAVVESLDDEIYFNLARGPMDVPAGEYELVYGFLQRGEETVQMRAGKMLPLRLRAGEQRVVEWGGPIVAEFDHEVTGDMITVKPNVAFYGQRGEEYHTFKPDAKSPKILVADKKTKKIYLEGRFGGC